MEVLSNCDVLQQPFAPNYTHENGERVYVRPTEVPTEWLVIRADGTHKRVRDLELYVRYTRMPDAETDELLQFANGWWLPDTLYLGWYECACTGERVCVRVTQDVDPTYYVRALGNPVLRAFRRGRFERLYRSVQTGIEWLDRFEAPHLIDTVTIAQLDTGGYLCIDPDGTIRPLSHEQFALYRRLDPARYWTVYCVANTVPRKRHETLLQAEREARRLAEKHRGITFTVMQAVSHCMTAPDPRPARRNPHALDS